MIGRKRVGFVVSIDAAMPYRGSAVSGDAAVSGCARRRGVLAFFLGEKDSFA